MADLQKGFEAAQAILNHEIQKGTQMMEEALDTLDFSLMEEGVHHVGLHGGRSLSHHVQDAKKQFIQKLTEALKEDGFEVIDGDNTLTFTLKHLPVLKLVKNDLCVIDSIGKAKRPLAPFEQRLKEVETMVHDDAIRARLFEKIAEKPSYIFSSDYEKEESELISKKKLPLSNKVFITLLVSLHPKSKQTVKDDAVRYGRHAEALQETLQNLREKEPLVRLQEENFDFVKEEAPKLLEKYNFGVMQ